MKEERKTRKILFLRGHSGAEEKKRSLVNFISENTMCVYGERKGVGGGGCQGKKYVTWKLVPTDGGSNTVSLCLQS